MLPSRAVPELRNFIGPPILTVFLRLWPDLPDECVVSLVREFRLHYDREGCLSSKSYPNVRETLAHLTAQKIRMFVLTNKPREPTYRILAQEGLSVYFADVLAPDSLIPPFVLKSEGARTLRTRHRLQPSETILVGDGLDDAVAAAECGFGFVTADYGYGNVSTKRPPVPRIATIKTFSEIGSIVLKWNSSDDSP